jgi:hypothetical protein
LRRYSSQAQGAGGGKEVGNKELETVEFPSPELVKKIKTFKKDIYKKYKDISNIETPQLDGKGEKIVDKRPDGYDYITEAFMRDRLDFHFPGWSWEMQGAPQFLGSEWVFIWGTLSIIDESLMAYGINPPYRKFSGTNGVRVKFKRDAPHTPENVIDIGNDVASANSKAFKIAVQRITHIGDDIYRKRVDEEGAGSTEDVLMHNPDRNSFEKWLKSMGLRWGQAFEILKVGNIEEITNFAEAVTKIKTAKGW